MRKRPRWRLNQGTQRFGSAFMLAGKVTFHLLKGRISFRNCMNQMALVGPESVGVALITAAFVGMVFTIQVAREFITFGATSAVGGVLAIALTRELGPVLTAVVLAGRVGSAFAAEIGTMKVTEQIDALHMLGTDPVDYLVVPRFIACLLMLPILNILSLVTGLWGGMIIADYLYGIPRTIYIESIQNFLQSWDIWSSIIKSGIFGAVVAIIGCNWGLTTTGGAKGVGQSTTAAVVMSLLAIFILNFFLSWALFGGESNLIPTF
ncbi:ABC transporter permease [Parathermosynechococcus lividus PCC 6715]|uniref:ABC transporter permease n=1 Tax=Parathermosynechococcus lividus PCC 6715 TaxID=1917166 RepID=A0A2D2Q1X4_PARLV|nr:MlaE family lipid ABC transporter permease subunit [Thermostichus lividus]ATS18531.1 ABC transporter permease [Thermostichus lividus PCC 6715]